MTAAPITNPASDADVQAVGASAVQFTLTLRANERYRLATSGALWFLQGTNPTAVKNTTPAAYLNSADHVILSGNFGVKVSIVQDGAATGFASLNRVQVGR